MATKLFEWGEFLKIAEELGMRPDEAAQRTALSRAYYFVYHLALKRAEQNGFVAQKGEATHSQLWRTYSQSPVPECNRLAQIAQRLNENRRRADYDQVFPRVSELIKGSLTDARAFSTKLLQLPPRLPDPKGIRQ